jgi:peptide/nickel transport system ATP-binding protein
MAMMFQEPMTALNPVHTIGRQVAEPLRRTGPGCTQRPGRGPALLERVGIPQAAQRLDDYPHQFSGGQRQRIMIAMALACQPDLLIADEPTTALDVTVQQQILDLIAELVDERGMGLILISHDLGVISQNVDRMLVMYGGSVVESGPTETLFGTWPTLHRACWPHARSWCRPPARWPHAPCPPLPAPCRSWPICRPAALQRPLQLYPAAVPQPAPRARAPDGSDRHWARCLRPRPWQRCPSGMVAGSAA